MDPAHGRDTTGGGGKSNSAATSPAWQLDLLMQKLRQKSKGTTLLETAKNVKAALTERRCIVDPSENQSCLDQLQQSIKVNSLQTMVEKLEMVTRQQGLKFTPAPGTTGNDWFISADMFYLELLIDSNGVVQEVKIQHEGKSEQQSCPEIVQSLQQNDFADLAAHLEGLVSIYQLNADKKTKSKVFIALQALESDLAAMASTYAQQTDGELVVMKSLLGLLQPRKGGHPVKLVFYITPYEFIDMETKKVMSTELTTILEQQLGMVATVSVQPYTSQKLQMSATVSISRTPDGKSIPRYGTLNATNSTWLQACFSVRLQHPIPVCRELIQSIQSTTGINSFDITELTPILSLITKHVSNGLLDCRGNKGLFVTLPEQTHHYFMTETDNLEGMMISNIPFTLASQLPQVIATLRQQLAFNTLVGSCVRSDSKEAPDPIVFEVNALSYQNLTVSFQHPLEDTLVTLEFDLRDVTHPQCHLHAIATASDIIPTLEEYACKVVHRTMSIPVTLRAVIRRWQSLRIKVDPPNPNFNVRVGSAFNPKSNVGQSNDMSCAAESERLQNQQQQHQSTQQVPGMVMNWNNSGATGASGFIPNSSFTISPVNTIQTTTFPNQLVSPYITLSNFQNLNQLNFNPTMVNMFASQIPNQQQVNQSSAVLMNLLDQAGQQNRKRKRKTGSNDSSGGSHVSSNMPRPSPSPSPSPKSSRLPSAKQSPKRRPSEGSDEASPRVGTPNATSGSSTNSHMLPELGLEGDPRWNIDITPVGHGVDTTFSKMLSSLTSDFQGMDDSDIEIESEIPGKFPMKLLKKNREPPKRSLSLDSSGKEQQGAAGGNNSAIQGLFDHSGDGFKPMVTPSLSITPVSGDRSATVNSILASMRPGIEIIPLPNPVNIPHSITVTPILPKPSPMKKNSTDEPDGGKRSGSESSKKFNSESRKRKIEDLSPNKGLNFGNLQMKSMAKPSSGGLGNIKRPSSVGPGPRSALAKGNNQSGNIGMSPNSQVMSKTMGGKPSVSTLKSVSSPGSSSSGQQQPPKPKPREKSKQLSTVGPASKMQKMQQAASGIKMELGHHGLPIPKLEPIGNMLSNTAMKVEQVGFKGSRDASIEQGSKNSAAQKPGPAGTLGGKKAGLQAVIDKLKLSQQYTGDDVKKDMGGKIEVMKGTPADTTKTKGQGTGPSSSGSSGPSPGNLPGSEYMIKPGGGSQGGSLKLTINKTKGGSSKDKLKSFGGSLKAPPSVPGLKKGFTPSRIPSPKLTPPVNLVNTTKKSKQDIPMSGQSKSPSMKGSPTGGPLPKTKSEGELDLTKKLFMPGGVGLFDGPKFDTKFQIPKKSRSVINPVTAMEKVEDLSMASRKEKETENFLSESPSSQTPPPLSLAAEVDSTSVEREPPTLTLASADVETSEKHDELPPILSAEIHFEPPKSQVSMQGAKEGSCEIDFISPESPDPGVIENDDFKSTPTIPTTPLAPLTEPSSPSPVQSASAPEPQPQMDDEDGLVMDIPSNQPTPQSQGSSEEKIETGPSTPIPGEDEPEKPRSMLPPRPPGEPLSPQSATAMPSVSTGVLPLVSVHIVHSPQPNSPARLLRSPLVVQSPHSHPSPYTIDDDLMDEALIG